MNIQEFGMIFITIELRFDHFNYIKLRKYKVKYT